MSNSPADRDGQDKAVVPKKYLFAFVLTTTLFALWGFANDFTNPLVRAFKEIFLISNFQSSLVQFAFYGGYATMAIPAALLIRKFSYKTGIIVGLLLYALGALISIPASIQMSFGLFLVGFYILTFGLAFLETTANPFILSMGSQATATRRLNLAQAFNPIGSLTGMIVASSLILPSLQTAEFRDAESKAHPEYASMKPSEVDGLMTDALEEFRDTEPDGFREMQLHDLSVVRIPYVVIALVVLTVMVIFLVSKIPDPKSEHEAKSFGELVNHISTPRYIFGVVAQAFYVGAQIMCWTYIIHYGMTLLGLTAAEAQRYNIMAMVIFLTSRFICTFILQYMRPGLLLGLLAVGGFLLTLGAIFLQGFTGLYCLIGVSACMSLMFPTIYGLALDGMNPEDAKLASAGLIFAIVGGALMPPLQGKIIDMETVTVAGSVLEGVRASFFLPAICFIVIAIYGFMTSSAKRQDLDQEPAPVSV